MIANKNDSLFNRYVQQGLQVVASTFSRFPTTIFLFLGLAVLLIYRIETPYEKLKDINTILDRLMGVMALGVPFSLSVALLLERLGKDQNTSLKIGSYAVEGAVLSLYYMFLFTDTNMVSVIRLLLVMLAMLLSFFFIPYLPRREHFETYVTNILTGAATTAFYTIVLALGLMAIMFAIKSLLWSDMNPEIYLETWILSWLIFAPFHFLYNLPYMKDNLTSGHFNRVIKVLLLYIVLPIITVYTLVLYVYFAKIIFTQVWPKGIVSYLVVSYTAVGIAAIFLVSPFRTENRWARLFTAVFTKAIFPLLGMMFISIGIRIGEFGFTENRYFILIIGLWSTFMMVFLNFSKGKNNTVLPVSLAVVALLTVFGPWNAFEISKMSQSKRFYQIAAKYDFIQDGHVVKNNSTVSTRDQQELTGVLSYFNNTHELSDLKYLPDNFTMDQMKKVFGFDPVYATGIRDNYFSYYWNVDKPVKISGYDIFFRLEAYLYQDNNTVVFEKEITTEKGQVKIALAQKNTVKVWENGREIYQYELGKYVRTLYDKFGSNMTGETKPGTVPAPDQENMIWTDETETVKIMIIFNNINGKFDLDRNELSIDNLNGEIFLMVK